jgi:UDP-N-acetylglucosamine acyltransferase
MSLTIHPTAVIASGARIGANVTIGPYCVVGAQVTLGDNVHLYSHVVIDGNTTIGAGTEIFPFASIGHRPQDKKFKGEDSRLVIGERNVIREHVTINPGTEGGGLYTRIGNDCLFMASAHVAHDCHVGSHVVLANNATLAGHVTVGNGVIIGGLAAVHQFVRIGDYAFVGGMCGVTKDLIPYGMIMGEPGVLSGLNLVGMKRRNLDRETMASIRALYKNIFYGEGTLAERVSHLKSESLSKEQHLMIDFMLADSSRSFCTPERDSQPVHEAA